MSEEDIDSTLRDLRLQRRNVVKALNDVLNRCGTDDGVSRREMEQMEKLGPFIEDFVKKANDSINILEGTDGDNDLLIDGLEMNVDLMEIK